METPFHVTPPAAAASPAPASAVMPAGSDVGGRGGAASGVLERVDADPLLTLPPAAAGGMCTDAGPRPASALATVDAMDGLLTVVVIRGDSVVWCDSAACRCRSARISSVVLPPPPAAAAPPPPTAKGMGLDDRLDAVLMRCGELGR